jgi:hypothetical protein
MTVLRALKSMQTLKTAFAIINEKEVFQCGMNIRYNLILRNKKI